MANVNPLHGNPACRTATPSGSTTSGGNKGNAHGTVWDSTSLDGDADGARKAKFLKLMGAAKRGSDAGPSASHQPPPPQAATQTTQAPGVPASRRVGEELEKQFEEGRMHTFTGRRAGLGMYTLEPTQ